SLLQLRPSGGRVFARARFAPGINSTGLAREVTMAATSTTAEILPRARAPFPASRPSDHGFFFAYVVLIWLAVLAGFVPDVIRHFQTHAAPYPIAVHVHAVISVAWLALLTAQVLLIR